MKKRILAILMALCMVMTVMPTALAAEDEAATGTACEGGADCEHEAAIGTAHYDTLAAAIGEAEDGDTVELLKDVELSTGVDVDKKVTLNLNDYAITNASTYSKDYLVAVKYGGDLTITGSGSIESESVATAIKMTITGETEGDPAKITVESGTLKGYWYGIAGNGTRHGTEITINGGEIVGISGTGIYHPQDGKMTVNGGEITGVNSAIELRSGELTINDGVLTATAEEYSEAANSSGTSVIGAALAISQHTTQKNISVTINGGEFDGVYALSETNVQNGDDTQNVDIVEIADGTFTGEVKSDTCVKFVKGGSFDESVDPEYLAEDRTVELNNNGTYTYHETVEDALAAAEEGAVITDTSDPDADPIAVVTVTFEGAKEKPITVLPGETITLPTPDDTRDEIFRYWTVAGDPIGTRYYGGETVEITEDVTFVANWKDNSYIPIPPTQPTRPTKPTEPDEPDETEEPVESELPFTDVDVEDDFYEAVKYVSENGLMTGVDTTAFAPYGAFTRAQIATILYRLEKEPAVAYAPTFPDVQEDQWFAQAVLWGNSKGILLGHDTGKFGPDDGVTFEQMLTILYRYAALKGYDTAARADVSGFECSDYAAEAVSWAAAHGMVSAADGAALKAPAARCQVAQVLSVFCQTVVMK